MIISSPLKRAKKTAELINTYLHLSFSYNDALKERAFGIAEGQFKDTMIKQFPNRIYPKQETRLALNKRVMTALNTIITAHPNQKILIVAHGAVINSILSSVSNHVIGSNITKLNNGSFSILKVNELEWKIDTYNQITHFNTSR